MRRAVADVIVLAAIALVSTFVTSYFEYKNHNAMGKMLYENNNTRQPQCKEYYPKIILTDEK